MKKIKKKIEKIIIKNFTCTNTEKKRINKIKELDELSNFDSLNFMKLIIELQKEFNFKINNKQLKTFLNKETLIKKIESLSK